MFGNTRKQGWNDYRCAHCGQRSRHPTFTVGKGPRYNRARCPKCGSTFLVKPEEQPDTTSMDGKSDYQRTMEGQGWTFREHEHVKTDAGTADEQDQGMMDG